MSWAWFLKRSLMLVIVWPTYCMWQTLQVTAYMRFELQHETLYMHLCLRLVVLLVMRPLLFKRGQNLHVSGLRHLVGPVPCWGEVLGPAVGVVAGVGP